MDSDLNIVYRNPEFHLSEIEVDYEVWEYVLYGHVISDACAQTIAAWHHSPGSPNSTVLSTMGAVTDDMSIRDFVTQKEFLNFPKKDQIILDALTVYIADRQKTRN